MLFTQELDYIVHARKVACILHDVEDLLIVIYAEMMEESKRVIMDREETGDEETTVHVEAWMEDDRVLICFYVDPEDLGGGTSDDDSESPIIIDTYVGEPRGTVPPDDRDETRMVLSG